MGIVLWKYFQQFLWVGEWFLRGRPALEEDPMLGSPPTAAPGFGGSAPVLDWGGARNSWPGWGQAAPASNTKNSAPLIPIFSEFSQIWLFSIPLSLLFLPHFSAEHHKPLWKCPKSMENSPWVRIPHLGHHGPVSLTGWSRILLLDSWTQLPTVCYYTTPAEINPTFCSVSEHGSCVAMRYLWYFPSSFSRAVADI